MNTISDNSKDRSFISDSSSRVNEKAPAVDAVVNVSASNDNLEAFISIDPPENGGKTAGLDYIKNVLKENNIVYGISDFILKDIAKDPVYKQKIKVAIGRAPVNGKDGTYSITFDADKKIKLKEKEDGTVDYRDLGIIESVKKNQVLCNIVLPTEGINGTSVRGEKILPKPGKPVSSMTGTNTALTDDGTKVYSLIDGQVEFRNHKINVNETLRLNNVDNSTGNIKVSGNIIISGAVMPKFSVEADGNVEIGSTVNAASIKAGGNVILRGGIIGSEVKCKGDLTSKFIEGSNVFSTGNISAEYIMNSKIKCGKTLNLVGKIAKIVGGKCVVGEDIVAKIIGSNVGIETEIIIGSDSKFIERQQEITAEVENLNEQIKNLNSIITLLKQYESKNRLDAEKKTMLENSLYSFDIKKSELDDYTNELEEINEYLKTRGYGKLICYKGIYPGARVTIGEAKLVVKDVLNNVMLYNDNEEIIQGSAK